MTTKATPKNKSLRVGLVVPHIFMHRDILPGVIFSPAALALQLADGLQKQGAAVTLFTPGPVETSAANHTADLGLFEHELALRGDTYMDLLKKHPFTFITLARQVQSELVANAFAMANNGELDVVHIYTNEEDIALPFARFCTKPVVLTHHDPFNFLVKYKNVFPKYARLNWISMSMAQRESMPADTNWLANIPHGLDPDVLVPNYQPQGGYVAYLGRIIEAKGVHLAIAAVKKYNTAYSDRPLTLKIAGKHYTGHGKDTYWQEKIAPQLDDPHIEYVGFIRTNAEKQRFLGNARALMAPSTFAEPFGMVLIEALACGTPVVGLKSGAIPEVIVDGKTGFLTTKQASEDATVDELAKNLAKIDRIDRHACRTEFAARFTLERMCRDHIAAYRRAIAQQ